MSFRALTSTAALALACAAALPALAKLPALSDDAKAKAAEAAAKAAHGDKVAAFQLCNAMNRVAAGFQANAAKAGKPASAPVDTPACVDPGPFAAATPAAAPASAPAAAAAPASAAATVAKK